MTDLQLAHKTIELMDRNPLTYVGYSKCQNGDILRYGRLELLEENSSRGLIFYVWYDDVLVGRLFPHPTVYKEQNKSRSWRDVLFGKNLYDLSPVPASELAMLYKEIARRSDLDSRNFKQALCDATDNKFLNA